MNLLLLLALLLIASMAVGVDAGSLFKKMFKPLNVQSSAQLRLRRTEQELEAREAGQRAVAGAAARAAEASKNQSARVHPPGNDAGSN